MGILELLLIVFLLMLLLGALPVYPYSRTWGYYPSSGLATILIVVLVVLLIV